ncbi:MAG TPA: hypothetical protein VGL77_18130 [Armatimonadota bacterium]|jgi:hypothetical protein
MAGRTTILTGAFGSGKTECALALACRLASAGEAVTLVDLDFINPYFRSQDHRSALQALGVQVVAPDVQVAQIDAPALPSGAREVIVHPNGHTLVDVGGDPAGAIVLGQFAPAMRDYELWAVVNFLRPTTATPEDAAAVLHEIAQATRLTLTGLISNTNLGEATTTAEILDGLAQCRILSGLLGIPIVLVGVPTGVTLPPLTIPCLTIARRLLRPWE